MMNALSADGSKVSVVERARAKINLSLHVTGRRGDGYHLLESLVAFADVGDTLELTPDDTMTLSVRGPHANALSSPAENLVMRAAMLLREKLGERLSPARMVLHKSLPVASGIGGGSADAAAALRGLNRLGRIPVADTELARMAGKLGADVPVCLRSRPALIRGIGEIVDDAPHLPDCPAVLVNPGVQVSTPAAFRMLDIPETVHRKRAHPPLPASGWADVASLAAWLHHCGNDLEAAARSIAPQITSVLETLADTDDVLLARMSGSGATCFALYPTPHHARAAAVALQAAHPGWWIEETTIGSK